MPEAEVMAFRVSMASKKVRTFGGITNVQSYKYTDIESMLLHSVLYWFICTCHHEYNYGWWNSMDTRKQITRLKIIVGGKKKKCPNSTE